MEYLGVVKANVRRQNRIAAISRQAPCTLGAAYLTCVVRCDEALASRNTTSGCAGAALQKHRGGPQRRETPRDSKKMQEAAKQRSNCTARARAQPSLSRMSSASSSASSRAAFSFRSSRIVVAMLLFVSCCLFTTELTGGPLLNCTDMVFESAHLIIGPLHQFLRHLRLEPQVHKLESSVCITLRCPCICLGNCVIYKSAAGSRQVYYESLRARLHTSRPAAVALFARRCGPAGESWKHCAILALRARVALKGTNT